MRHPSLRTLLLTVCCAAMILTIRPAQAANGPAPAAVGPVNGAKERARPMAASPIGRGAAQGERQPLRTAPVPVMAAASMGKAPPAAVLTGASEAGTLFDQTTMHSLEPRAPVRGPLTQATPPQPERKHAQRTETMPRREARPPARGPAMRVATLHARRTARDAQPDSKRDGLHLASVRRRAGSRAVSGMHRTALISPASRSRQTAAAPSPRKAVPGIKKRTHTAAQPLRAGSPGAATAGKPTRHRSRARRA